MDSIPAVVKVVGLLLAGWSGGWFYLRWLRLCRRACDACRLEGLGSAYPTVPHTCPFARWFHSVRREGDEILEFNEPALRHEPMFRVMKGGSRDPNHQQKEKEAIRERRKAKGEAHFQARKASERAAEERSQLLALRRRTNKRSSDARRETDPVVVAEPNPPSDGEETRRQNEDRVPEKIEIQGLASGPNLGSASAGQGRNLRPVPSGYRPSEPGEREEEEILSRGQPEFRLDPFGWGG